MLTPPKIQKLVGDAPLPGAACAAGIWFHTGGRDLPAGSDSIKGAARQKQAAAARIGCECGESELEIQTDGVKFRLWVPCGLCGGTHQAEVDVNAILTGRGVGLACPETKQLCCYAGDTAQVQRAMEELAIRAEKEKCEEKEAFTDNVIMYEVLSELKDIAARGGIRCSCGSTEYGIQVHRDAVDLVCRRCGGKLRLPAGTDEDLDRLCCQMTLTIRGAE